MKALLAALLAPVAYALNHTDSAQRLLAYARLRQHIGRVPKSCLVLGLPEIHGDKRVLCGEKVMFYPGIYLETRAPGRIEIGHRVVLSRGVHVVSFAGVTIGAGSMVGEYTSIRDALHRHHTAMQLRESGFDARPIYIGREVWIGRGVAVLPGVTIGDGAVVGANAVVTHDVAAGAVVAGVPARRIHHD